MKKKLLTSLVAVVVITCFQFCSKGGHDEKSKTFVLVHGAWQAPYVWDMVKKKLEDKGQKVIVVELPGHGNDTTIPALALMVGYSDKVISAIKDIKEKVILVGHSMGGMVISEAAEKIPSKIEKLVYIGAYVPANGQSLLDLASMDAQSLLPPSLIPSKDQLTLDIVHDNIISIFCEDAPANIQKMVLDKYRVEPAIPFINKVALTTANFGSVDKYYVHTLMDHAIGMNLQTQMLTAAHITKVFSLNTGHCPFLSQPDETSKLLLSFID